MAKSAHPDAPSASGNGSRPILEALQPEAIVENCNRLLKHIDEMNRTWVGSLQQANDSGWNLASQLARCADPMEANRLCTEWMAERRDAILADSKRMSDMWFKLCEAELATAPVRPFMSESQPSVSRMGAAAE
jgi:hypothetical protein